MVLSPFSREKNEIWSINLTKVTQPINSRDEIAEKEISLFLLFYYNWSRDEEFLASFTKQKTDVLNIVIFEYDKMKA